MEKKVTTTSLIEKSIYDVKSEGFVAKVSVLDYDKHNPFIHEHHCRKGSELLWRFNFWNDVQLKVLEYHNKLKTEQK